MTLEWCCRPSAFTTSTCMRTSSTTPTSTSGSTCSLDMTLWASSPALVRHHQHSCSAHVAYCISSPCMQLRVRQGIKVNYTLCCRTHIELVPIALWHKNVLKRSNREAILEHVIHSLSGHQPCPDLVLYRYTPATAGNTSGLQLINYLALYRNTLATATSTICPKSFYLHQVTNYHGTLQPHKSQKSAVLMQVSHWQGSCTHQSWQHCSRVLPCCHRHQLPGEGSGRDGGGRVPHVHHD